MEKADLKTLCDACIWMVPGRALVPYSEKERAGIPGTSKADQDATVEGKLWGHKGGRV